MLIWDTTVLIMAPMKIDAKGRFTTVPLSDRFWDKVNKNGPLHPTDKKLGKCWIWTGAKHRGYGVIWTNNHKKRLRAHRVSWEMTHGKIPSAKGILHSCDNPPCINPKHLRPGTDHDNRRDMVVRNRSLRGERNPMARLTEKQVLSIRAEFPVAHKTGPRSEEDNRMIERLCLKYRVSKQLARRIATRERWKHV